MAKACVFGSVLVMLSAWITNDALALPPPVTVELRFGTGAPVRVSVTREGDDAVLRAQEGEGTAIEERARVPAARDVSISMVRVAPERRVALVRVAGEREYTWLLGAGTSGPRVVWGGQTSWWGDPGERSRYVVQFSDRTGDGRPDIILGQEPEGGAACGFGVLLRPHAVDPQTLRVRPISLRQLPDTEPAAVLVATEEAPEWVPSEPRTALPRFAAVSSRSGTPYSLGEADSHVTALTDGDLATAWVEGHPGNGQWEFVTFQRTPGAAALVALSFVLRSQEGFSGAGWPTQLRLVGHDGVNYRIQFPERPRPEVRYWVQLTRPLTGDCLSLVVESVAGRGPRVAHGALVEIGMLSQVDEPGAIERMVDELVADSREGDSAARVLSGLGRPAVLAVAEAWDRLSLLGRRRAVRVLRANLDTGPMAREVLTVAARTEVGELRGDALSALTDLGHAALPALTALVAEPGEVSEDALRRLVPVVGLSGLPVLLVALRAPGGADRPELRAAIRALVMRDRADAAVALDGAIIPDPAGEAPGLGPASCASLALALREFDIPARGRAVACAVGGVRGFPARWRLVRALAVPWESAGADRWLAHVARDAEEWMLRREALRSLGRRGYAGLQSVARRLMGDAHPRVRAEGVRHVDVGESLASLTARARRDRWPMVRVAALRQLARDQVATPIVREAIGDPNRGVRAAAISAVSVMRDREAWPAIRVRLENRREWPEVIAAGVAYIGATCQREGVPTLVRLIRRVYRGQSRASDQHLASEAVMTLRSFDGQGVDGELRRLQAPHAPAYLRRVLENASHLPRSCAGDAH